MLENMFFIFVLWLMCIAEITSQKISLERQLKNRNLVFKGLAGKSERPLIL